MFSTTRTESGAPAPADDPHAEVARLRDRLFAVYQLANQHGAHPQIIEAIEDGLWRQR